ncbi:uncharacterized protein LOC119603828 [Lucilia sericata]|uniref:uncharacterized protein LOC119603828 n=1 Tax=Lucilia sericata TaxID=13632 RepID=UPI0018A83790|nr:uncharacterized protein LOC119603828 [Lucilia sericata]
MENKIDTPSKPKRVRLNPTRKWTIPEEKALIEFLMENRDFEKPSTQVFYKRFCEEKQLSMHWTQVRSKVRNMPVSYNKAKAWEVSTGAGSMQGDTVKATLLKMCSYFDELDDLFGNRIVQCAIIEDSLESECESFLNSTETEDITTASDTSVTNNTPSTSRKGIYSRTAVSEILMMQTEMLEIKKQKLDNEKNIKEREVNIMERTLLLKEIKIKERLAMEELKLKYK